MVPSAGAVSYSTQSSQLLAQSDDRNDRDEDQRDVLGPHSHPQNSSAAVIKDLFAPKAMLVADHAKPQNTSDARGRYKDSAIGLALSMSTMTAIIAILAYMHARPLMHWTAPISLNTAIALLATVSQTSFLVAVANGLSQLKWVYFQQRPHLLVDFQVFDDASRGPWGALMLLWKVRWKAAVASTGAALILLALAMQAFVQQTISLPLRSVREENVSATMPQGRSFDGYALQDPLDMWVNQEQTIDDAIREQTIENSIISGLFSPLSQVAFRCGSGNCTWTSESLGVCSKCEDVSSTTTLLCQSGAVRINSTNDLNWVQCNYTTPGGVTFQDWRDPVCWFSTSRTDLSSYALLRSNFSSPPGTSINQTYAALDPIDSLLHMAFFRFSTDSIRKCTSPRYPRVTECRLHWCAKHYSSKITNGKFDDSVVATKPLLFGPKYLFWNTSYLPHGIPPVCNTTAFPHCPGPATSWIIPGFKAGDLPTTWHASNTSTLKNASKAFWINYGTAAMLAEQLEHVLDASLDTTGWSSSPDGLVSLQLYKALGISYSQPFRGYCHKVLQMLSVKGHMPRLSTE